MSYILVGGLGGFGLELADWLIIRGAKNLVLVSRSGIKTGYQKFRLSIWKKYGTIVKVSTADVSQKVGVLQSSMKLKKLGPVAAIFNLAIVLKDALFKNQTPEMFNICLAPKAITTKHFDEVSRKMCPQLEDFVVFSSVSCGRGSSGQTNYGMSNSVMERICEERKKNGYPALAIEWGAIGEVGFVADMQINNLELEVCGTLQQRIAHCLQLMDIFLLQKSATIVSSMVVAEKRSLLSNANTVEVISNLLGVTDLTSVSYNTTMAEMGMDSMTSVEIKQVLERNFEIFLTPKQLRGLTFAKLEEYDKKRTETEGSFKQTNKSEFKMDMLFGANVHLLTENFNIPLITRMESKMTELEKAKTMLLIPGIEGAAYTLEHLCKNLYAHTYVCQVNYTDVPKTFFDQAQSYLPIVEKYLSKEEPFIIIGYSFGSLVAFELASLLETNGFLGTVVCIDGSPIMFREVIKKRPFDYIENYIISAVMTAFECQKFIPKYLAQCETCTTFQEKLDGLFKLTSSKILPLEKIAVISKALLTRVAAAKHHTPSYNKITSNVLLYKPTVSGWTFESKDYGLSSLCKQKVAVSVYEGDHRTILQNKEMINGINALV